MSLKIIGTAAGLVLFLVPAIAWGQVATSSEASTTPVAVEAKVRAFFADTPVMIAIADCESKFTQFDDSGAPLDGGSGGMIGVFQISKTVHAEFALSLGFDIDTVDGNLGYARYLYGQEGTNPWISSFPCWSHTTANPEATSSTPAGALSVNLSFGMQHPQVLVLQKLLNTLGFTIAQDGPGSVGNETIKFGNLTRDSVRRFQCAKGIVCSGDEGSTGYGYVGSRTRAALLSIATTSPSSMSDASQTKAAQIAALETQIAQYLKLASDLQTQVATLKASQ